MEASKMKQIIFIIIMILCLMTCDFFKEVNGMSSEKVLTPTPGAPVATDDYNAQNGQIQAGIFKFNENFLHLTNWDNLLQPAIKQGVYISHGGALFLVKNLDESISGSPSDGRVYIRATQSGDFLTFDFTNSASGYSWNYEYCGFYDGAGNQLLPYVLVKSSSNWYKHTLDNSENRFNISAKIKVEETTELGPWNMNVDYLNAYDLPVQFTTIYNPLGLNDVTEFIKNINIMIRSDDQAVYYIYGVFLSGPADAYYVINTNLGNITISVNVAGLFATNIDFNDIVFSRGNINWEYKI